MTVGEVMTRRMILLRPDDDVVFARQALLWSLHHQLPVVDAAGCVLGMVTESVILRHLLTAPTQRVSEIMNPPSLAAPEEEIRDVALRMAEGGMHTLAVVHGGRLIGVVTSNDLLRELANEHYEPRSGVTA